MFVELTAAYGEVLGVKAGFAGKGEAAAIAEKVTWLLAIGAFGFVIFVVEERTAVGSVLIADLFVLFWSYFEGVDHVL